MIIDSSYFDKGSLFIPNNKDLSAQPVGTPTVQSDIDFFIDKYERELLYNALGVTLYNELKTANESTLTGKWKDLVDGTDYTIDSKLYRWDGLKGYASQSLIAFYVYCQYLRNDQSTYTTTGIVKNTAANAENYDPTPKFIKAWNSFIIQYQAQFNGLPEIIINRSGKVGLDFYGNKDVKSSLYQYLTDANVLDPTAFPDFEFRFYESYNSFGI